jgi:SRSO17 transposase
MTKQEITAHRIAQEIQVMFAKQEAELSHVRKDHWHNYYDPHAATELGCLIFNALREINK